MRSFENRYMLHRILMVNNFANVMEITKINKVTLNFGFKNFHTNFYNFLVVIFACKVFVGRIPLITKSKKAVLTLKIKKGEAVGCYIVISRKKLNNFFIFFIDFLFLNNFVFFSKKIVVNSFTLVIPDLFLVKKLSFFFEFLMFLVELNVSITTTAVKKEQNLEFLKVLGFIFK